MSRGGLIRSREKSQDMKRTIGRLIVGVAVATAAVGAGATPALADPPPCTGTGCNGGNGATVSHGGPICSLLGTGNFVATPSGHTNVHCHH